ncbi:hypothetical protein [Thiohalomonas denitrificans]|uniref:Low-complexity protein n=1 Tax=Thiohalomonas denitrificans TaxID=415747 RepID=A0A1G5Q5Q3_9GAMM|nr:hypothetical protein [Thiohalomonas denitrificans]SCZ57183.1 hypothetical protein SAMN03097708_01380 [Thiohalomonas denitrificans]
MNNITKPISFAAGTAMAFGLSGTALGAVDANPFSVEEFGGLRIAEAGQGQCGGKTEKKNAAEANCGAKEKAAAEANCGAEKAKAKPVVREASCGEAKCGAGK